jgi:hypothetical protein
MRHVQRHGVTIQNSTNRHRREHNVPRPGVLSPFQRGCSRHPSRRQVHHSHARLHRGTARPLEWSLGRLGGFLFFSPLLKTKTEDAREPDSFRPQTDRPGTNRSTAPLGRPASKTGLARSQPRLTAAQSRCPRRTSRASTANRPTARPTTPATDRRITLPRPELPPPTHPTRARKAPASPPPIERLARSNDRASLVVGVGPCGPPLVTEFPTRIAFSSGDFAPETSRPE